MRGLAAVGKGLGQEIVQRLTVLSTQAQVGGLGDDLGIGEFLELRRQRVDLIDDRAGGFDFAVIGGAKDLFRDCSEPEHFFRLPQKLRHQIGRMGPNPVVFGLFGRLQRSKTTPNKDEPKRKPVRDISGCRKCVNAAKGDALANPT